MRVARLLLAALVGCSGIAGAAAPTLSGTYRADCAPYDGAAFIVTLRAQGPSREFWLRANVPLAQAAGLWTHGMESRPGSASIALCATRPEVNCAYPQSGSFRIGPITNGRMRGTLVAHFEGGKRRAYSFVATAAKSARAICG